MRYRNGQSNTSWVGRAFTVGAFVLSFAVLLAILQVVPSYAASDSSTLQDLQQKASELNKQIRDSKAAAAQKQKEAQNISGQIDEIKSDISDTEQKISDVADEISAAEAEISQLESDIAVRQQELDTQRDHQDETLRVLYETGEENDLILAAGATSISEYVEHTQYLEALEDQIDAMITQVESLKRDLETRRNELSDRRDALEGMKAQQEAYRVGLADQKARKDALLTRTKDEQKKFEAQVAEAQKLNQQVESQMAALRARLTQSKGPGIIQARDRGTSAVGFQWPANYRAITTYFGGSTPFQQSNHGGIDLANSAGTPIYAAADGTVTTATSMYYNGQLYAYGNYIVIGHNARFSSLYGHFQSFAVSAGQEVKRGQIIGYMGSTGWSTGPHLHFEIWEYSTRVDPLNYLP